MFIFDNDVALMHNIDHLAYSQTPSAVWHPAVGAFQWARGEACAVTTGLLGLMPSQAEFQRALQHLYSNNSTKAKYDGGDQEFWMGFNTWYELPVRYQAHQVIRMHNSSWSDVAAVHAISGLRGSSLLPPFVRKHIRDFY